MLTKEQESKINQLISGGNPSMILASLIIEMNGFLDEKTVATITGLSRTERYRMRLEGTFPEMRTIKGKVKGWRAQDILKWLEQDFNGDS